MTARSTETAATPFLASRWARMAAASLMVVGGIMAATTAASAWAEKTAPEAAASATAAHEHRADHHRAGHHGGQGAYRHAKHHHGMEGGMMFGGPRLERMLDDVKATDAQREKIRSIADTARTDLKALHEQGKGWRQQSMDLLAQPTLDVAAAEAQRQKMLAHHDAVSKRMMTAMLDTAQVLTPEQRTQVAERMKARKAKHQQWREHRRDAPAAAASAAKS